MGYLVSRDDGWRMPDWLWERIEPLLPERPSHPLGCHNPSQYGREEAGPRVLQVRGLASAVLGPLSARAAYNWRTSHA